MNGILYGVGIGPGDPELITLKAARIIAACDIIAVPDSGSGEQMALSIAAAHITDKPVMHCDMPMTKDEAVLFAAHEKTARAICAELENGKSVAFLTLGDPSVYSTYMYVHRLVLGFGHRAEMIAGVPSFCAAAAALGVPLCEGAQPLHIVPASHRRVEEMLELDGVKLLMKSGKSLNKAISAIEAAGLLENSAMVERCGLPGEKLTPSLKNWDGEAGYFTTIIVREAAV